VLTSTTVTRQLTIRDGIARRKSRKKDCRSAPSGEWSKDGLDRASSDVLVVIFPSVSQQVMRRRAESLGRREESSKNLREATSEL